jgi:hypothetical protein
VPITTEVVSSNPVHGEEYSIQHYVIKIISDLQQVGGFLRVLRFPPPNETDHYDITEILLKVELNTMTLLIENVPTLILPGTDPQKELFGIKSFPVACLCNFINKIPPTRYTNAMDNTLVN